MIAESGPIEIILKNKPPASCSGSGCGEAWDAVGVCSIEFDAGVAGGKGEVAFEAASSELTAAVLLSALSEVAGTDLKKQIIKFNASYEEVNVRDFEWRLG